MKVLNTKRIKIICLMLIVIMMVNIIMPLCSYADKDEDFGGELFKPIAKFLAGIADLVIKGLQKVFIGSGVIKDENGEFAIKFSPAILFSNRAGLDANFIHPTDDIKIPVEHHKSITPTVEVYSKETLVRSGDDIDNLETTMENDRQEIINEGIKKVIGEDSSAQEPQYQEIVTIFERIKDMASGGSADITVNGKQYILVAFSGSDDYTNPDGSGSGNIELYNVTDDIDVIDETITSNRFTDQFKKDVDDMCAKVLSAVFGESSKKSESTEFEQKIRKAFSEAEAIRADSSAPQVNRDNPRASFTFKGENYSVGYQYTGYDYKIFLYSGGKETDNVVETTVESVSKDLQPTISKWYKALRLIAMVGLLSVLVYVGIRVIISSTGQEKAKYKKMLADWFAAMCILFILHYIMALIMTSVDLLTKVFSTKIIGDDGTDLLISDIRGKLGDFGSFLPIFGDLVIYLALVILTCVFTVQYLKRLVYLAFLTMVAPLIALTYPLDKIKDGQAQAFTLWIREYIFNALLPVVHILIYAIFVSSASELVKENPIYAVVCIGFMVPAEKFIRKMFGFEKASTVSPLGAAAGGAMAMNIVNNLKKTGGGSGSGGSGGSGGGSSKVRTNGSGYIPAPGGGNGGTPGGNQPSGPFQPETNPNPAPNPQDGAPDTPPLQPTPNGDDDSDGDAPSSDRPLDNPNGQNDEQVPPDAPNPLENGNNDSDNRNPDENTENENTQRGIIRNLATRAKNRRRKIKHAITRKIGALRGNITRRRRGRRGQQGGGNSGGSNGGPTNTDLRYNQQPIPPTFNPQNTNGGSNGNPAIPQEDINDVQEEVEHNEENSGPSTSFQASSIFGEDIEQGNMNPNYSRLAGLTGVLSSYINKPTIKKAATKAGKFAGRSLRKAIVGGIGVAALGTIGLAAGVASGDLSKAAQYTGAAALVGFKKANDIGDRLTKVEKQNRETYKENKWGTDEYETRNAIKEMEENREFLKVAKAAGLTKDQREKLIRKYYANGIVDQNKIMKALTAQQRINQMSVEERIKNGYGRNQITQNEMIAAQKLSQSISASYWGQPQNRIRFKQDLVTKGVHPEDAARAVALISYLKGDLS